MANGTSQDFSQNFLWEEKPRKVSWLKKYEIERTQELVFEWARFLAFQTPDRWGKRITARWVEFRVTGKKILRGWKQFLAE